MENDILSKIKAADQAKKRALRELHKALGYASAKALAEALLEASEVAVSVAGKPQQASAAASTKAPTPGKRSRISGETKQAIRDALQAGEAGNGLTKRFGVSYGIVHLLKTELGLVAKKKASKKQR